MLRFNFYKLLATVTDWLVGWRLALSSAGRILVAQRVRGTGRLSRRALIFDSQPCAAWRRYRVWSPVRVSVFPAARLSDAGRE